MNRLEKTSKELILELEKKLNDDYEFELSSLENFTKDFLNYDGDVYIKVKDGLLVIPCVDTVNTDNYTFYDILLLEAAYLAHENKEEVKSKLEKMNSVKELLESCIN